MSVGKAVAYFMSNGIPVVMPLQGDRPYDFVIDRNGLKRVQVRVSSYRLPSGVHQVALKAKPTDVFNPDDTDFVFVVCDDNTKYLIPTTHITTKTTLDLGPKYQTYRIEGEPYL